MPLNKHYFYLGDSKKGLHALPRESVNCVVTSPPYWNLRDYGEEGQLGLESSPEEYVQNLVDVFREVRRVLKKDGTLWLNLGDTYNGTKIGNTETKKNPRVVSDSFIKKSAPNVKVKDLIGIPWMVAFALRNDGWYLRSDIIWHKPNTMPESVRDRPTKAHEYIFLLSKSSKYYYDKNAVQEPATNAGKIVSLGDKSFSKRQADGAGVSPTGNGLAKSYKVPKFRNKRTVWSINTKPFKEAHFAVFPPELIEPCVLTGSPRGGIVLDPFGGAGTTNLVAMKHGRDSIYIDLSEEYLNIALNRLGFSKDAERLFDVNQWEIIDLRGGTNNES